MSDTTPVSPKVAAAGISGAALTVIMAVLMASGIDLPEYVVAAVVTCVATVGGYFTADPLRRSA